MRSVFVDSLARQHGCEELHGRSYVLLGDRWATNTNDLFLAEAICEEDGPYDWGNFYPLYILTYDGLNCISRMQFAAISEEKIAAEAEKAYKCPAIEMTERRLYSRYL